MTLDWRVVGRYGTKVSRSPFVLFQCKYCTFPLGWFFLEMKEVIDVSRLSYTGTCRSVEKKKFIFWRTAILREQRRVSGSMFPTRNTIKLKEECLQKIFKFGSSLISNCHKILESGITCDIYFFFSTLTETWSVVMLLVVVVRGKKLHSTRKKKTMILAIAYQLHYALNTFIWFMLLCCLQDLHCILKNNEHWDVLKAH